MKIPKVMFRAMTLEENIETIKWAYYENNGLLSVHDFTIQYFPELANLDENLSREEVYRIIEAVVEKDYKKNESRIKQEVQRYNSSWEKYNDIYLNELSNYLGVSWPLELDVIDAKVGLIPVFPRYLDFFSFSVSTGIEDSQLTEICAHETQHFLLFEKWKVIYPQIPRREYDSPYITWQYSEMVTDPILNNKPFCDMFSFQERGYDSFYQMYDGEELVMDKLRQIYSKNIPVDEKIGEGFEYVKNIFESENELKK